MGFLELFLRFDELGNVMIWLVLPSQEGLLELFEYDPITGKLFWRLGTYDTIEEALEVRQAYVAQRLLIGV